MPRPELWLAVESDNQSTLQPDRRMHRVDRPFGMKETAFGSEEASRYIILNGVPLYA